MHYGKITLEEAMLLHPNEVSRCQATAAIKLKRSKAKAKGKDISELEWSYEGCVSASAGSISDLISGKLQKELNTFKNLNFEQKLASEIARTQVELWAKMPGAYGGAILTVIPESVIAWIRESHVKVATEQARYDALTQNERDAEVVILIASLVKMSEDKKKKPCSHCPECKEALSKTFYTTTGLVFCRGICQDLYYEKERAASQE